MSLLQIAAAMDSVSSTQIIYLFSHNLSKGFFLIKVYIFKSLKNCFPRDIVFIFPLFMKKPKKLIKEEECLFFTQQQVPPVTLVLNENI